MIEQTAKPQAAITSPTGAVGKIRYDWLDVLRAIAIVFVIFGHQAANGIYVYGSVTSHVKLSLFFCVSGFLFSKKKVDNAKEFFKNKVFRLLLPYVYLSVIGQTLTSLPALFQGTVAFPDYCLTLLKQLLHGDILWFIPNLFLAEIVMFAVLRISKKNDIVLLVLSVISLIGGYFALTPNVALPFRINALLITWPLLVFGYFIRDYIHVLGKKTKLAIGIVCAFLYCMILAAAKLVRGQWLIMNINDSKYDHYALNIVVMLIGTLAAFMLVQFIPFPRFVKTLGRNTLFYYAFHNQMCSAVMLFIHLLTGSDISREFLKQNRVIWLAIVMVAMLLMMIPCYAVNQIAPFLVGKKISETNSIWLKKKRD